MDDRISKGVIMKQLLFFIICSVLLICCVGCATNNNVDLPFSSDEIEKIELFRFFNPAHAKQKIVTSSDDINSVVDKINSTRIKNVKDDGYIGGGGVTSIRFFLQDNSAYEIIFVQGYTNIIYLHEDSNLYRTTADIDSIWDDYDYSATPANESDLPKIYGF